MPRVPRTCSASSARARSGAAALSQALARLRAPAAAAAGADAQAGEPQPPARSPVEIEGVGDLPTTMARCCAPVPPEPIAGYVTLGRGVTIHRARCPNLLRMRALNPERVLRVEWNLESDSLLPVRIRVEAFDRRGLLRDVSDVMALEKLSIEGVNSDTDPNDRIATIVMRTAVRDSRTARTCAAAPERGTERAAGAATFLTLGADSA